MGANVACKIYHIGMDSLVNESLYITRFKHKMAKIDRTNYGKRRKKINLASPKTHIQEDL